MPVAALPASHRLCLLCLLFSRVHIHGYRGAKHIFRERITEARACGRQVYFYLWEHHLALLHGMVAEYIGRAMKAGMPAQHDHVHEKQLVGTSCH